MPGPAALKGTVGDEQRFVQMRNGQQSGYLWA
jgi:hypothetical protein